jgi:hypothetical protein
VKRHPSYYVVGGIDLQAEAARLCRLPALGGPDGPLAARPPTLAVRRASRRPRSRLGFAVPSEWRISVTAYPGAREGDLLETLLHELVHLAVGRSPGKHAWHGREFRLRLRAAMNQAYGVAIPARSSSRHGAYADAIQARRGEALAA